MVGATLLTLMMSCGIWTEPDFGASYQAFEKRSWAQKTITPDMFTSANAGQRGGTREESSPSSQQGWYSGYRYRRWGADYRYPQGYYWHPQYSPSYYYGY